MIDDPVPYVAFTWPGRQPACANRAACESPITASTGIPSRRGGSPRIAGNGPADETTVGSTLSGTPKSSSSSGCHPQVLMSSSCVREALPTSITWSPPRRLSSHESTVPRQSSPRRLRERSGSWASSSQVAFGAENIGSTGRPLSARTRSPAPSARSRAQWGVVRWSCQLSSGPTGSPLARSQSTSDSRCVLRPTAATAEPSCPSRHRATAARTLSQISVADCSTQPGCGWACPTGADPRATIRPAASTSTAFVALVPWSIASSIG